MKPNELRIGNYVYSKIRDGSPNVKQTGMDMFNHSDEFFAPIQLTDEWLTKFGFKDTPTGYLTRSVEREAMNNMVMRYLGGELFDLASHDDNIVVRAKYVHELQNLYFALSGHELEIK